MVKTISIIKANQENIAKVFKGGIKTDVIFKELQRDTVGRSGSNPTWGQVYYNIEGKTEFKRYSSSKRI